MPRKSPEELPEQVTMGSRGGRSAANARERIRMRVLSRAFARLKTCLPWVPNDTKLSKLDTLRLASCYIRYLRRMVNQHDQESLDHEIDSPLQMSWPFGSRQVGDETSIRMRSGSGSGTWICETVLRETGQQFLGHIEEADETSMGKFTEEERSE